MRSLIVTALFPTEALREPTGTTIAVRKLVQAANDHGLGADTVVRIKPLVNRGGLFHARRQTIEGIEVYDIPIFGYRSVYWRSAARFLLKLLGFRGHYDLSVCHKIRNVEYARSLLGEHYSRLAFVAHKSDIAHPFMPGMLQYTDAVFARSHALATQLKHRYGIEVDGIVSSGIDPADFCDFRSKAIDGKSLRIAMAATFKKVKNIPNCLEAIAQMPADISISVDIFGSGPMQIEIEEIVERLELSKVVRLHGFRTRKEVLDGMFESDLFLMPSAPETLGMAFLEAMAQGCVVIGHQGWGIDGIVHDGVNGFLVQHPTPDEIRHKIKTYLQSDRASLHKSSYQTALMHTTESAGRNYFEQLSSVL